MSTPRIMNFDGCMVRIFVSQNRKNKRWSVVVSFCPGLDEMWETLTHAAEFALEEDAYKLSGKIREARKIDLNYWFWSPSVCSPFAFLQEKPVAVRFLA